jgi:hypothetical protein
MRITKRSVRTLTIGVVALALLFLLAACGGGSSEAEEEEGEEAAEVVSVPASLGATEADAEGIVDVALSDDRAGLREQAAHLKADAEQAAMGPLAEANVPADKLRELRGRAANVDELARGGKALEVALAANAVSGLMPALYGYFDVAVPTAVLELDYLEREAQLRSMAHEDAAAAAAVGQLRRTWQRLRPQVVGSGGQDEAASFAEHLAAMERLRREGDAGGLQDEAKNGLELVDELERVFA